MRFGPTFILKFTLQEEMVVYFYALEHFKGFVDYDWVKEEDKDDCHGNSVPLYLTLKPWLENGYQLPK